VKEILMKLAELCPEPLPEGLDLPLEVFIRPDLGATLAETAERYLGDSILLVADPDTRAAASDGLEPLLRSKREIREHILPSHPHTDDAAIQTVLDDVKAATGLLAVGSGTVTDIVKAAATKAGLPCVVFGTAASMNGYASGISAVMSGGLKTTVPVQTPRAILLDTDILRAAPRELGQAGLGDLLSKPLSVADWWLSDQMDATGFSELPGRIVDAAIKTACAQAAGLPKGDPKAYEALAQAIVLSGVSMVVAGSSSPASGGEHLLSHLWDMEATVLGRPLRLHGAQVGVASIISAAIFRRVLQVRRPAWSDPSSWEDEERRIRADHGPLAEAVLPQARGKHGKALGRVCNLEVFWSEIRETLLGMELPGPEEVRAPLVAAGAPHTLEALGLPREDALRALRIARDIRDRYTILDLAFDLGVFPPAIEEVLDQAGV